MALLLAVYQKMRLIREKNQLVLEQSQYSSKLSRIEKNIERQQKRFTALIANVDKQAKMFTSQASIFFQNQCNLGPGSVNPMNYSGMNAFVANIMEDGMTKGGWFKYKDEHGNDQTLQGMDSGKFQAMMTEYMANGRFLPLVENEKTVEGKYANYAPEEVAAFMAAMQKGQFEQTRAQQWVSNANQQYATNISIWAEAEKAKLEAQQDEVLEPLNYQQTMLELEKTQKDARLKRIETELQNYTELASKEAESTAPTFGLR